jgi:nucleoside-diphosphate-sugar epimerase
MRYDLVVNTFVKDALSTGRISLHRGGEMWRPLADVKDAARAYIALIRADSSKVNGQVFNLVYRNFRISELALRVREALRTLDMDVELVSNYGYQASRDYRVSGQKLDRALEVQPTVSIEESVTNMVREIRAHRYSDFENPRYYNIEWMRLLQEAQRIIEITGGVFDFPERIMPMPRKSSG